MTVGKARLSRFRESDSDKYHQWLIDEFLGIEEPARSDDHPIRIVRARESDMHDGPPPSTVGAAATTSTAAARPRLQVRPLAERTSTPSKPVPRTALPRPELREMNRAPDRAFSWLRLAASVALGTAAGVAIVLIVRLVTG